jgi:dihydroorotase
MDLLFKNAQCVTPEGVKKLSLKVENGIISKMAEDLFESNNDKVVDLEGKFLLPGIIDSQVHLRWPGLDHKEDLETGSRAAVAGGVTTFLEMPNTHPPTTDEESLTVKVNQGHSVSRANFGFFMGATAENLEVLKTAHEIPGCVGIKIFLGSSTGPLLLNQPDKLKEIFNSVKLPIAIHSENENMLRERIHIKNEATNVLAHPEWRSAEVAFSATKEILGLARECGKKLHILHISTKEEMEYLKTQKDICTVEVTPQHLLLESPDCYERLGTYAQMNPPIRSKDHQDALWEGLLNKTVDVIGSDHAPHLKEEKNKGYPNSPSGMPGVQTIFPVMLDCVNKGKLTLTHLTELLCSKPAEIYSLKNKGQLKVGFDADLVVVDMDKKTVIKHSDMFSKCGHTPFDGVEIQGFPTMTVVGGNIVMENGKIHEKVRGKAIVRGQCE